MISMIIQIMAIALPGALAVAVLVYEAVGPYPCPCNN